MRLVGHGSLGCDTALSLFILAHQPLRCPGVEGLLDRIEVDPGKLGGKPVVRGTRIPVSLVVEFVASGMSADEIIREYPELTEEDVRAALLYAAKLVEKEVVLAIE